MKNKSLIFEAHPSNIKVDYIGKELVRVNIQENVAVNIEFDNDVLLKSRGDFVIASDGEINFITNGKPLCIDTLNSNIHLNSREGKYIKDLPESIEYRKEMKKENKKCIQIADMQEAQNKLLKERVTILEGRLDKYERIIENIIKLQRR